MLVGKVREEHSSSSCSSAAAAAAASTTAAATPFTIMPATRADAMEAARVYARAFTLPSALQNFLTLDGGGGGGSSGPSAAGRALCAPLVQLYLRMIALEAYISFLLRFRSRQDTGRYRLFVVRRASAPRQPHQPPPPPPPQRHETRVSPPAPAPLSSREKRHKPVVAIVELSLEQCSAERMPPSVLFIGRPRLPEELLSPYVANLAVVPEFRRAGLARRLLRQCEREVRDEWKRTRVYLHVDYQNVPARTLYEQEGYREVAQNANSARSAAGGDAVASATGRRAHLLFLCKHLA